MRMVKLKLNDRGLSNFYKLYNAVTKAEHFTENDFQKNHFKNSAHSLYSSYEHINLSSFDEAIDDSEENYSYFSKTFLQPRFLTRLPSNLSKHMGEKLEVVCLANVLFPSDIEWFLNDVLLTTSTDDRIVIENNSSKLIISSVKKSDCGKLACIAKNRFGSDISICKIFVEDLK